MAALAAVTATAAAQDTYESANVLGSDLNGTARYVGMGGALEALGADISTIGTNPAGLGLFRHSNVSLSAGLVSQQGANKFDNLSKTNMSFDQAGFVWANIAGDDSGVNFGFNFHKSRNFDRLANAFNSFSGASLSKLAHGKALRDYSLTPHTDNGGDRTWVSNSNAYTQWDMLYQNVYNVDDVNNPNGDLIYSNASDFYFDEANRGWIADFDFNLSGSINQRVFWGFTVGVHSVNYKSYSLYDEMLIDGTDNEMGTVQLEDDHRIEGSGFDFKLGFIIRPIADSPFRFGLSVSTPTWYTLTSKNYTTIYNNAYGYKMDGYNVWGHPDWYSEADFEYKYVTPWKFGLSLGHTVEDFLALGASYEYCDYSSASTRIYNGSYDYYGHENTNQDRVMTRDTENKLKGVHLLKVGAELKPDPAMAVRLGYNYQTKAYNDNAFRDTELNSPGVYYSSTPDYVNWGDTHRITAGLGFKYEGLSIDLAYQYAITKGTFYPFQSNITFEDGIITYPNGQTETVYETCVAPSTALDFKRHQLLLTLGYTF